MGNHRESDSWAAVAVMLVLGVLIIFALAGGGAFWIYKTAMRARQAEAMAFRAAEEALLAEEVASVQARNARRADEIAAEARLGQAIVANPPSVAAFEDLDKVRRCLNTLEDTWRSVESDGELSGQERTQMREALEQLQSAVDAASP